MRLTSLTSGLPYKAALWSSLVFLTICAVAGCFLIRAIDSALVAELAAQAESEAVLLSEIYTETGEAGLIETLRVTGQTTENSDRFASFLGTDGSSLIGPISILPDFLGTRRVTLDRFTAHALPGGYVVHVRRIDQRTLVVGRNDAPVRTARARLIVGLSAFAAVITLTILCLGLWASRMSLHRLEQMGAALHDVGEGNMSARLPVLKRHDQFDQVSIRVNQNLDLLERAVGSMKATASAIAHDLKTPLSHVQYALHAAADASAAGQDPLAHIETALQETEELNGIFEAVLRISRIRATRDHSGFEMVDLDVIAEKTIEFMTPLAEQHDQSLTLETTHPAAIFADKGMVQQALVNLVKNAVTYAGEAAQITIVLSDRKIAVQDNGPGVPDQDPKQLLEPFTRADSARSTEGSGLGLALVNAVAERHNALVSIKNLDPGFSVTLIFNDTKAPSPPV
ncbi:HAMP domain-containing sensor histidine kinase [Phaeobacter sp. HF9A]|uniref:sensor histidine kinase n=1 Tax=Phaeobacter sp. HF9A TaxID=2721561 RepID=UPI001430AB2D|nr:HAMP domain-containing histidine kinase [Phaeobacter sp. HF9A]